MEENKHIGLIINELRKLKKISVVELSSKLGLSKQGVYDTFSRRSSMTMEEMNRWANALEIDTRVLIDKSSGKKVDVINKSADNGSFGSEVLLNIQKLLEEEIREKNDQIRALQEALKESQQIARESQRMSSALLGKSREYSTTAVIPDHMNGKFWSNI